MAITVEVVKTGGENVAATIRKFTRRSQSANTVKVVRRQRYFARASSQTVKKKRALKLIERRENYRKMIKEGKIAEPVRRSFSHAGASNAAKQPAPMPGLAGTPIAR